MLAWGAAPSGAEISDDFLTRDGCVNEWIILSFRAAFDQHKCPLTVCERIDVDECLVP